MILDVGVDVEAGKIETTAFTPSLQKVQEVLGRIPRGQLANSRLVTAAWVQMEESRILKGCYMYIAWAICRADTPFGDLFVAPESPNSTRILAYKKGLKYHVAAFLTITCEQNRTYLIEAIQMG